MASMKRKRVSKKLKSSWRKHININDVEEFLEDRRLEERLGPPLSTISDDQLFTLDKTPQQIQPAKSKRSLILNKPLKCFSALQSYTKVPDPISKRNNVRTKEERKSILVRNKDQENKSRGILKHKEIQSLRDKKIHQQKKNCNPRRGEFNIDIWADGNETEVSGDWITKNTKEHNLKGVGKLQRKIGKAVYDPVLVPSVELPHPGMSYNPSFADHQHLLSIVTAKESTIIKKEEHLTRVTRGMFHKVTEDNREAVWLNEMSEGLKNKESEMKEEVEPHTDNQTVNPPVKNSKKSLKQKRKQREQLEVKLAREAQMLQKKKISDIHQIKLLTKQLEKQENKNKILRHKREKVASLKRKDPKVVSSTKYEEPDLEFNMGPEISGNLRNVKKEGNLLADRFKSLQKRNIIEPSIKRVRKKAKIKRYTKSGHKENWKITVAR